MKVELTMVLDIPDKYADDGVPKTDPLTPNGVPWSEAFISQEIFDNLTNYANCKHLQDALQWMVEEAKSTDEQRKDACLRIVASHKEWSHIISAGLTSTRIKILEG